MYKIASLARFSAGTPKHESGGHWAGTHAALMRQVSPLAGYVQTQVARPLPPGAGLAGEEPGFDGYACAWWESLDGFRQAEASPAWHDLIADGALIFDMDWLWNMSAHLAERVVVDGPRSGVKAVWVARFGGGTTRDEGRERWESAHGRLLGQLGAGRYVQSDVVGPIGADGDPGAEIGFDVLAECWFPDEQRLADALRDPAWAAAAEDARSAFDPELVWAAIVDERVVVEPPAAT
jgi:hypothetical protein